MATIVYLDVEDEITSAAARIRTAPESRVALVVPFGSRIATSRMNFRLLAREAAANGRRLDVVAPDASARALAASAGLPVFASVGELESALEGGDPPRRDGGDGSVPAAAAAAAGGVAGAAATSRDGRTGPSRREPDEADLDDDGGTAVDDRPRTSPRVVHGNRGFRPRAGLLAGFGVLVLALAVAGVAAWILLPAATITLTPRLETIGPISLTVRADPDATAVDPDAGVIPATTITIPVRASGEFEATGARVEQTPATGGVRWTNCDPTRAYTIPEGTVVRTQGDVRFRTDAEVFLPVAILTGAPDDPELECQSSEVAVTAAQPGPAGNVPAGTITVVPSNYNRNVLRVTNPAATTGGTRTEFPRIDQADVDAALEQLRAELEAEFEAALADPVGVPEGATVFPETAALGEPRTDVDPATLVGQEVATFTLQMAADGTVQAVNEAPLQAIAESRLEASVGSDHELVEGSSVVDAGAAEVSGGIITFPVRGWAQQRRPLDAAELAARVRGLPADEAREILEPYGAVDIELWPDWVSTIPTLDARVTFVVREPESEPLPTPEPEPSPTTEPESIPDASASEPVPSPS